MFTVPLSIFATNTLSSFVENQSIPIGAGFFSLFFFVLEQIIGYCLAKDLIK